jgi:hypothetical protein
MAYRAHVQVYDPTTQRRVTPEAVLRVVHLQPPVHKGTRQGRPGFWIEQRGVESFRYNVLTTLRLLTDVVGYAVTISATNGPSFEAVRGLAGSLPKNVTVNRG